MSRSLYHNNQANKPTKQNKQIQTSFFIHQPFSDTFYCVVLKKTNKQTATKRSSQSVPWLKRSSQILVAWPYKKSWCSTTSKKWPNCQCQRERNPLAKDFRTTRLFACLASRLTWRRLKISNLSTSGQERPIPMISGLIPLSSPFPLFLFTFFLWTKRHVLSSIN